MKYLSKFGFSIIVCFASFITPLSAQSQTPTLSPVIAEVGLPFSIELETAPFLLPVGIQGHASAIYEGQWVIIAGRTNGMHTFDSVANNFPPQYQNTDVYIIDPANGKSWSRSLASANSGLSQAEIDTLSVVAPQFFQKENTLYIVGGYGINTATGEMETKDTLTAVNLDKIVAWVKSGKSNAKNAIRQIADPLLQVTGGSLFQANDYTPFLLMLGQNFQGLYRDGSNGIYTQQIRAFYLLDDGDHLKIIAKHSSKILPDYRRRDLNIIPIIRNNEAAYVAFAGVFTLDTGVWTVPITIFPDGSSHEPNPNSSKTFKQAMNHYNCPAFGLYSTSRETMYAIFPGGISYGYFSNGSFTTDSDFPFINQMTTITIDKQHHYQQYLMDNEYPDIISTGSNPGNQLLFGAEAQFFPVPCLPAFSNGVLQLDLLPESAITIGYIVGGIMSTVPNTSTASDSTASPYVFKVKLIPPVGSK